MTVALNVIAIVGMIMRVEHARTDRRHTRISKLLHQPLNWAPNKTPVATIQIYRFELLKEVVSKLGDAKSQSLLLNGRFRFLQVNKLAENDDS